MTQRRVGLAAVLVASLVTAGVGLTPVQAAFAATSTTAPLVTVKAHRLADAKVAAHKTVSFTVRGVAGVPSTGVAAVVLKLTAAKPAAAGALVAYGSGAKRPSVLSVSFTAGHDATAEVVVVPGSNGKVTTYNGSAKGVTVIATVAGYYRAVGTASVAGNYLHLVAPRQLTSTLVKAGGSLSVTSTGLAGVPAGASSVLVELSALSPAKAGKLTVSPSGGTKSKAVALAFSAGHNTTALVAAVPGVKGRLVIASSAKGAVRVRVDILGYVLPYLPPAAAPTGVSAVADAGGAVVSWTAAVTNPAAPVLRYEVTAASVVAKAAVTHTVATSGPVTSLAVTGLTNGVAYVFTVFAVTKVGDGATSAPSAAVTPVAVPAAPVVVASSPAADQVTVVWTTPNNGGSALTGYTVTGARTGPATFPATVTTETLTGLTVGQSYSFTVTATNAVGTSAVSAPSNTIVVSGAAGTNVTSVVSLDSLGAFHGSGVAAAAPSVTPDGRFVSFSSSSALAGTDTNGLPDVFLRDRQSGSTVLVSAATGGAASASNGATSLDSSVSSNGGVVAFDSTAPDLVAGDTNAREDVFARTIGTATTVQVSLTDTGTEPDKESYGPAISADGNLVAFVSNATNLISTPVAEVNNGYNIYLRNLTTGAVTRVSQGALDALPAPAATTRIPAPTISADGRFIGYSSAATNIAAGDTNGAFDSFVFDTTTSTTTQVSVSSAGVEGNAGSGVPSFAVAGNGDVLAVFQSDASNLVAGDTNGKTDVFVHDLTTGVTTRVSLGNDGSQSNDNSTAPSVSADGTRVLFTSAATNLVAGDTNAGSDAFVRYLTTGETVRVSVPTSGAQLGAASTAGALSGNGTLALFTSADPGVVTGDMNGAADLFARTLG